MHQPTDPQLRDALEKPKRGLRLFAAERHLELETAFEELERACPDDPHVVAAHWRVLDAALREHLDAEEDLIVPAYQLTAPEEAVELRCEHARIRKLLDEIELDVRQRVLPTRRLRDLVELLRAHAEREDASMYPWAERNLPLVVRRQLFVRIARWLRGHRL